jgi:tetratricopeptide (TPR) repeat protein
LPHYSFISLFISRVARFVGTIAGFLSVDWYNTTGFWPDPPLLQLPGQWAALMPQGCKILVLGLLTLMAVGPARAGVYSTREPKWEVSRDYFRKFQEQSLTPLKQLASPQAEQPWQKYLDLAATALLVAKDPPARGQPDTLKPEERLDLATCLLRIRYPGKQMPEKAIAILNAANDRDKDNFLVMSTLGTANQVTGEYQRADVWLTEGLRYWAKPFDQLSPKHKAFLTETMKWNAADFAWFGKCEKFQRDLVRFRMRELKKGPLTFAKALERLDPLFPDQTLRFVGESGKFEPGKIAKAEADKLPPDAIEVVEQLLIWMPDDLRLYWLLGELLNARGDVENAKIVFMEFLGKFSQMPEFQGMWSIDPKSGQPIVTPMALLPKFVERYPEVGGHLQALLNFVPPPPNVGEADVAPKTSGTPKPIDPKKDGPVVASMKVDWQALSVGLGGGMLVGFLLAWRLRDKLRRRQGSAARP